MTEQAKRERSSMTSFGLQLIHMIKQHQQQHTFVPSAMSMLVESRR